MILNNFVLIGVLVKIGLVKVLMHNRSGVNSKSERSLDVTVRVSSRIKFRQFIIGRWLPLATL